jgi:hypothetical protein
MNRVISILEDDFSYCVSLVGDIIGMKLLVIFDIIDGSYSLMIKNDIHKTLRFFKTQISQPYKMTGNTSYPRPILQLRASPKINTSQLPSSLRFLKQISPYHDYMTG